MIISFFLGMFPTNGGGDRKESTGFTETTQTGRVRTLDRRKEIRSERSRNKSFENRETFQRQTFNYKT
jgi:hypothetical protein